LVLKFTKSKYADSIYYADMFKIEGKIWVILGYGKSEAARIASNKDSDCDLSRDCVALAVISGELYGRFDPGALGSAHDESSDLHKFHKIDFIAYCLSPEQTSEAFGNQELVLKNCGRQLMSDFSVVYPYPAYTARYVFSPVEIDELSNPLRRSSKFLELLNHADFDNLLLVPFMENIDSKAALYQNYERNGA
ncbi:hypothetical protein ACIL2K_004292, partial [Vibrio vulnificus]